MCVRMQGVYAGADARRVCRGGCEVCMCVRMQGVYAGADARRVCRWGYVHVRADARRACACGCKARLCAHGCGAHLRLRQKVVRGVNERKTYQYLGRGQQVGVRAGKGETEASQVGEGRGGFDGIPQKVQRRRLPMGFCASGLRSPRETARPVMPSPPRWARPSPGPLPQRPGPGPTP